MKVTIAVPNFNHGKYLKTCINSILKQEYEDYEIFIYDNWSVDDSIIMATHLATLDSRIKFIMAPEPTKSAAAGINDIMTNYATGEIGMWLNADDALELGYLKALVPCFNDPKVILVRCGIFTYEDLTPTKIIYKEPKPWDNPLDILYQNKCYPASLFRRSTFLEVGGIDVDARFFDWDLWVKLAFEMFKGGKVITNNRPLVRRREHGIEPSYRERDKEHSQHGQPSTEEVGYVDYNKKGAAYIQNKYFIKRNIKKEDVDNDTPIQTAHIPAIQG